MNFKEVAPGPFRPSIAIEPALPGDEEQLLGLYSLVYESHYPIPLGTDRALMSRLIRSEDCLWLVARDKAASRIVGSTVFEIDRCNRIGKITGMVVHPDHRHRRLAQAMLAQGTVTLLSRDDLVHSLYATTRTNSTGPQMVFLHEGYLPLGIFPNAHRIRDYETLTLFAKFAPGVLDRRALPERAPACLRRIYEIAQEHLPHGTDSQPARFPRFETGVGVGAEDATGRRDPSEPPLDFEVISAPRYVQRRFEATFTDPYERFYPFHTPNTIFASTNGEVEIFAHHSKPDRYCTIVALTKPIYELRGRIDDFFTRVSDHGISYLEVLMGVEHFASIEALSDAQFLPSALYPAMREFQGRMQDFVLMSRTLEPLNFHGMSVATSFKPFVDQYVDLWKDMHLNTLEIFNEYR